MTTFNTHNFPPQISFISSSLPRRGSSNNWYCVASWVSLLETMAAVCRSFFPCWPETLTGHLEKESNVFYSVEYSQTLDSWRKDDTMRMSFTFVSVSCWLENCENRDELVKSQYNNATTTEKETIKRVNCVRAGREAHWNGWKNVQY
jgi:hypothetical protein